MKTLAKHILLGVALLASVPACTRTEHQVAGFLPGRSMQTSPEDPIQPEAGWESSGGSGVVCFADEAAAKQADIALKRDGYLSPEDRARVKSVHLLDRWDAERYPERDRRLTYKFFEGHPSEKIFGHLLHLFSNGAPLFRQRVQLAIGRLSYKNWNDSKKLRLIPDAHPFSQVETTDTKCRRIQLVARMSRSVKGFLPKIALHADLDFIENWLSPLDQAMVRMHEILYLIAREAAHRDSDLVRQVTAYFFSDQFIDDLDFWTRNEMRVSRTGRVTDDDIKPCQVVQKPLTKILGDYIEFFVLDPLARPKKVSDRPSQYSRHRSLTAMLKKVKSRMYGCYAVEGLDPDAAPPGAETERIVRKCKLHALEITDLDDILTPEQALLYLSMHFTWHFRGMVNPEFLVTYDLEDGDLQTEREARELFNGCAALPQLRPIIENSEKMIQKAQQYCDSVGLPATP